MKKATGLTTAKARKVGRFGLADVTDIKMKISNNLKLTKDEVTGILIHEMIHVYFLHNNMNEDHGPEFKKMGAHSGRPYRKFSNENMP